MQPNREDLLAREVQLLILAKDFDAALRLASTTLDGPSVGGLGRATLLDAKLSHAAATALTRGDAARAQQFTQLRAKLRPGEGPLVATAHRLRGLHEHCLDTGAWWEVLAESRDTTVRGPRFIDEDRAPMERPARSPEVVAGVLASATVTGGDNSIVLADGAVVNDYGRAATQRYSIPEFVCNTRDTAVTLTSSRVDRTLARAIDLTGSTTGNYFHWLLEYLPSLRARPALPEFANSPVLVDAAALAIPQLQSVLRRVVGTSTPILGLGRGERVQVEELLAFSPASWLPQDLLPGLQLRLEDTVVSHLAVDFCRSLRRSPKREASRCYLSRRGASVRRRLVNEAAVEATAAAHGYAVVSPGDHPFQDQVELFSGVTRVCAPVGAALANLVFCPEGTRTLALMNHRWETSLFSQITDKLGQELWFLVGKAEASPGQAAYHANFVVPPARLGRALTTLERHAPVAQETP